jgi:hypothetical protein
MGKKTHETLVDRYCPYSEDIGNPDEYTAVKRKTGSDLWCKDKDVVRLEKMVFQLKKEIRDLKQ